MTPLTPPTPVAPRNRLALIGGVVAALALAGFGIFQWNSYQNSLKVVDSCGNTARSLAAAHNLLQACATVSGHVSHVTALASGNLEVQLQLDRDSSYARNVDNQGLQGGGLLVILSCEQATALPTQYFATCSAFQKTAIRPASKTPLTYTGNLVINQKFGWVEMQPADEAPGA